ncbi:helix-turn-helix domain protein [Segniliparus rotundus DSM 44985]|uniref:Helix-turn-helix domain protein n=1 Tax=Segniliparus rotundus (strain ATCC BAA-972 / CDC 1076 / CIP 108378 / DSM 44985 / JCM 13578) TaxID=640132 RepID=D6ZEZ1_SEGRD|nr:helix-turn-helix transcriptional regulator [Segniliparus rotundus]ADG97515.1 helix-turn-helix domain protein [Segniliparus rotundus DSM 44985]
MSEETVYPWEIDDFDALVGRRIKALRTACGMSQTALVDELAQRGLNLPQQTIVRIEQGARSLKFSEATAFASALRVPLEVLQAQDSEASDSWINEHVAFSAFQEAVKDAVASIKGAEEKMKAWSEASEEHGREIGLHVFGWIPSTDDDERLKDADRKHRLRLEERRTLLDNLWNAANFAEPPSEERWP